MPYVLHALYLSSSIIASCYSSCCEGPYIPAYVFCFRGLPVVVFPKHDVHFHFPKIQESHFTVLIIGITVIYFQNISPWKVDETYKFAVNFRSVYEDCYYRLRGYGKWQSRAACSLGGNNRASLSLGGINTESWSSRMGLAMRLTASCHMKVTVENLLRRNATWITWQ
jgi:hypothetical protein